MRYLSINTVKALALALATATLAACGTVSKNVADDGLSAQELRWKAPNKTTPMHRDGTYPLLDQVRTIEPGMNKAQIAALIGYPHFSEGIGPREWNYVFHLPDGQGGHVLCEYKVLFDTDKLAQSFYWNPESCADLVNPPSASPAPTPETFTLSADALFGFDKAVITPTGAGELDALVSKIQTHEGKIKHLTVRGYTDEIGALAYNQGLSKKRADAVGSYLINHGVPASLISTVGMGPSDPVKTGCLGHGTRGEQISCLAPNRRVEVEVSVAS